MERNNQFYIIKNKDICLSSINNLIKKNLKGYKNYKILRNLERKYFILCPKCSSLLFQTINIKKLRRANNVHHIDRNNTNNNLNNLIMLCKKCHIKEHNKIGRFKKYKLKKVFKIE